ncbi:MAG: hypothetical protein JWO37_1682, partial [Acidimicrobiales bacterium]|nr:hypothetical protein [Acidimicrobiales bacterium]
SVVEAARQASEAAAGAAADLAGQLRAAKDELVRAEAAAARSATLSPDEECPVCGQSLGDAFEQVQSHRRREVEDAAARVEALATEQRAAAQQESVARGAVSEARTTLAAARQAWAAWQERATRRTSAEEGLAGALAVLGEPPADDELARLLGEVDAGKRASAELHTLEGRLERSPAIADEIVARSEKIDELTATRDALRVKVKKVGFDKDALAVAKAGRDAARKAADRLAKEAEDVRVGAARAGSAVDNAKEKLAEGEVRHADMTVLVEDVRHTGRVAELLGEFRNTVVQSVGPLLAQQASELFAELTDHEYDALDVNPETYEIQITDDGIEHGLGRFSGSETDLANLALRIAISEHVRLQSGGQVGLLVLDEVFGPLDDDRKARMLLALERLRGRFRQVLVITHDSSIKEEMPSAIEVVRLPGRRATARVVGV